MSDDKDLKRKNKIDYHRLNEAIRISHRTMKIFCILLCIACVYVALKVFQELKILKIILDILAILAPLFIGIIFAWIFNPIVSFLQKKGIKRVFSIIIVYVIFIGLLALLIGSILPILYDQIVSFAQSLPSLIQDVEGLVNRLFNRFNSIDGLDISGIENSVMSQLETFGNNLSSTLPSYIINFIGTIISGITTFVIGLIIGFFILLRSDNVGDVLIGFIPKKWRNDVSSLTSTIDGSLRNYLNGVIIDAIVIFLICSFTFSVIGLRAPLLFAIFCAITNVIPYVGPYIGAVPAVIVGFSISPTTGFLTILAIAIIQFIEGNLLQEYIMSKTTKLNPVTIIIGLLIFGHFGGILGMIISTPILSIAKQFWIFFDNKYNFFSMDKENINE